MDPITVKLTKKYRGIPVGDTVVEATCQEELDALREEWLANWTDSETIVTPNDMDDTPLYVEEIGGEG